MEKMLHACILTGAARERLVERARELAAQTVCEAAESLRPCRRCRHCRKTLEGIHPDVSTVERLRDREGKLRRELVVDQIRALAAEAAVLPNEAHSKVYILPEAERMNENAQNAFLKLLEEPPAFVRFLLCAENAAVLLPTVRSRCALLHVQGAGEAPQGAARARAQAYLKSLGKPSEQLRCCAAMEKLEPAELRETLEAMQELAPETLEGSALLALEAELERLLGWMKVNVSVRHILSMLSTYEMRNDS